MVDNEHKEERKRRASYMSEDERLCKVCKERYIHVAAIDIVISQGIWNICGAVRLDTGFAGHC
jgi:hypothetical protein